MDNLNHQKTTADLDADYEVVFLDNDTSSTAPRQDNPPPVTAEQNDYSHECLIEYLPIFTNPDSPSEDPLAIDDVLSTNAEQNFVEEVTLFSDEDTSTFVMATSTSTLDMNPDLATSSTQEHGTTEYQLSVPLSAAPSTTAHAAAYCVESQIGESPSTMPQSTAPQIMGSRFMEAPNSTPRFAESRVTNSHTMGPQIATPDLSRPQVTAPHYTSHHTSTFNSMGYHRYMAPHSLPTSTSSQAHHSMGSQFATPAGSRNTPSHPMQSQYPYMPGSYPTRPYASMGYTAASNSIEPHTTPSTMRPPPPYPMQPPPPYISPSSTTTGSPVAPQTVTPPTPIDSSCSSARKSISCPHCEKIFLSNSTMRNHCRDVFYCRQCKYQCQNDEEHLQHIIEKHIQGQFRCTVCNTQVHDLTEQQIKLHASKHIKKSKANRKKTKNYNFEAVNQDVPAPLASVTTNLGVPSVTPVTSPDSTADCLPPDPSSKRPRLMAENPPTSTTPKSSPAHLTPSPSSMRPSSVHQETVGQSPPTNTTPNYTHFPPGTMGPASGIHPSFNCMAQNPGAFSTPQSSPLAHPNNMRLSGAFQGYNPMVRMPGMYPRPQASQFAFPHNNTRPSGLQALNGMAQNPGMYSSPQPPHFTPFPSNVRPSGAPQGPNPMAQQSSGMTLQALLSSTPCGIRPPNAPPQGRFTIPKCGHCQQTFDSLPEYYFHCHSVNYCSHCQLQLCDYHSFCEHIATAHMRGGFCNICSWYAPRQAAAPDIIGHIKLHSLPNDHAYCISCNKHFDARIFFKEHMIRVHGLPPNVYHHQHNMENLYNVPSNHQPTVDKPSEQNTVNISNASNNGPPPATSLISCKTVNQLNTSISHENNPPTDDISKSSKHIKCTHCNIYILKDKIEQHCQSNNFCTHCSVQLKNYTIFINHTYTVHVANNKCSICSYVLTGGECFPAERMKHAMIHSTKNYKQYCFSCKTNFESLHDFIEHCVKEHVQDGGTCMFCDANISSDTAYGHIKQHLTGSGTNVLAPHRPIASVPLQVLQDSALTLADCNEQEVIVPDDGSLDK